MSSWKKQRKHFDEDSRIKYLMLAIFVIGLLVIGQLYRLQIYQHPIYAEIARKQQEVSATLEPKRGRIFLANDKANDSQGELFPLATNKQFALVFAKPNVMTNPQSVAEGIYTVYDEARTIREVEVRLNADPAFASSTLEFKKFKQELDLKAKKTQIINNYLELFSHKESKYVPIIKKADDELVAKIKALGLEGIDFTYQDDRYYPEGNTGSHLLGFLGYVGDERRGRYGLEGYFNTILSGQTGSIKADRDARGGIIVMNAGNYKQAQNGSDIFLTVNRSIEFQACQKLAETVERHGADGGSLIVQDPKTGAIIAMCSYPDYDPNNYQEEKNSKVFRNPAIYDAYEPGSTFKAITMASALDAGKVVPETTYIDNGTVMVDGWDKPIHNSDSDTHGAHGLTTMTQVLEFSLNTGAVWTMQHMGAQNFADYVRNFGFGSKLGIEMDTESSGDIYNIEVKKIRPINAATASFGQGITVTPLQMVNSYSAIANGGHLMKPYIIKEIVDAKGNKQTTAPVEIRRVLSEHAASLVTGMLVSVVENGHAKGAHIPGYYIAGKTGTAQVSGGSGGGYSNNYIHSFIGFPANNPKFVILTKIDNPKDARYAESTAIPLFAQVAPFVVDYFEMQKERDPVEQMKKNKLTN
jgi:cell division protein FtsI/penicillin-binding protein 2